MNDLFVSTFGGKLFTGKSHIPQIIDVLFWDQIQASEASIQWYIFFFSQGARAVDVIIIKRDWWIITKHGVGSYILISCLFGVNVIHNECFEMCAVDSCDLF